MLPGKHHLASKRDGVSPSNNFKSRSLWNDQRNPNSVAIDMASATRTTSQQDYLGGVRTGSTLAAAEVSHPDEEERTGKSCENKCTIKLV